MSADHLLGKNSSETHKKEEITDQEMKEVSKTLSI